GGAPSRGRGTAPAGFGAGGGGRGGGGPPSMGYLQGRGIVRPCSGPRPTCVASSVSPAPDLCHPEIPPFQRDVNLRRRASFDTRTPPRRRSSVHLPARRGRGHVRRFAPRRPPRRRRRECRRYGGTS